MSYYIFHIKKFSIEEVFEKLNFRNEKKSKEIFADMKIKMNSLRLHTFKEKGCKCVECGRVGTHFRLQTSNITNSFHFGLWSDDDVQMTKDHIIPRSVGGMDNLNNMQTMCEECNSKKGNSYTAKDIEKGEALNKNNIKKDGNSSIVLRRIVETEEVRQTFNDYKFHNEKIKTYLSKNNVNPFLDKNLLNKEIKFSVDYIINYSKKIIEKNNGDISVHSRTLNLIPLSLRIELINEFFKDKNDNDKINVA